MRGRHTTHPHTAADTPESLRSCLGRGGIGAPRGGFGVTATNCRQCCLNRKAVLLQSTGSAAVLGCSAAAFQRHAALQRQWHHCLKAVLPHGEGNAAAMCRHCCHQLKTVLPHWEGSVTVQQQCCCRPQALLLQSTGSAAVLGCSAAAFQRHAALQRQWHHCLKAVLPHCEGNAAAMCRHCCHQLKAVLPHWEGSVTAQQQSCCRPQALLLQSTGSAAVLGCSAAAYQRHAALQRQWHHCLKAVLPHCEGTAAAMCRHCCHQLKTVLPHWEGSVTVQQQCCCRPQALLLQSTGSAAVLGCSAAAYQRHAALQRQWHHCLKAVLPHGEGNAAVMCRHCCHQLKAVLPHCEGLALPCEGMPPTEGSAATL